jgi:hypothetical protein
LEGAEKMRHRFGPSLYFANDKVIFDSLNQHAVNIDLVRELLNERGIIVSADTTKEELAQYFSRLTADYFDHQSIAIKLGRVAKRERITASELTGNISNADVIDALNALKVKLEESGDQVTLTVADGKISALISYEHIDYTKIDLRQVEPRDAIIEFTREPSGSYVVRSTQNPEIDPIVESVVATLHQKVDGQLERSRINMESIAAPDLRTKFFEALIKGIEGYKFETVTEAYCFKPRLSEIGAESDEEDQSGDLEQLPYVEKVSLRGEGVNRSFVIKELYEKGYYTVKVVWRVRLATRIDSDIYELEAQFSRPEHCTGFSYRTKSVIMVDEGKVTGKRRSPKKDEEDNLFRLIEQAAKRALSSLTV